MEEEKEPYRKESYTTFIFCNIMSMDEQHVWFIPDWWDVELEFQNLHEVAAYWSVLPLNLHGLNMITDCYDKLAAFCAANNQLIDVPIEAPTPKMKAPQVKVWQIAQPWS